MAFHPLNGQPPSIGPRPGQVGVVQSPIRWPEGVALGSLLAAAVLICCHWLSKNWPLANAEPTAININDKLFLLTYFWTIGQHAAHSEYVNQRPTQPLFFRKSFDIQAGTLYSREHQSVAEQSKAVGIPPAPPLEEKRPVMNGFLFLIGKSRPIGGRYANAIIHHGRRRRFRRAVDWSAAEFECGSRRIHLQTSRAAGASAEGRPLWPSIP
jgi:hypothetical protein